VDFTLTSSELGRVAIAEGALAQIIRLTAVECYGVVGMSSSRLKRLLGRSGIELSGADGSVSIAVHVVVAHGLNLAEVASTVRNRVSYEVERMTGLAVAAVEVHIEAVKASA
jgi:uncharacterized alkaline shock family protein YloU